MSFSNLVDTAKQLILRRPVIEFFCEPIDDGVIPAPEAAVKTVPQWFKRLPLYCETTRDMFGEKAMTAKKCKPLLDAMTTGFVITTWADFYVRTDEEGKFIEVHQPPAGRIVDFHSIEQLGGMDDFVGAHHKGAIKILNRWTVKTAPGYSTLFVPALNQMEKRFELLAGIVDTDKFPIPVNFPGKWLAKNFDAVIPAGTPLMTCIPFKRSSFGREPIVRCATDEELKEQQKFFRIHGSRKGYYSNELREPRK